MKRRTNGGWNRWRGLSWRAGVLVAAAVVVSCSDLGEPESPSCSVAPQAADFGEIRPGEIAERTIRVENPGFPALSVDTRLTGDGFALATGVQSGTLHGGAVREITVRFQPPLEGTFTGVLVIGEACASVALSGTASGPNPLAQCEVLPAAMDFGAVRTGESASQSFFLRNVGSVQFSGNISSPCADFVVESGGGPFLIDPGDSVAFAIRFAPSAAGHGECVISTGVNCDPIVCTGIGYSGVSLAFDVVPVFNSFCTACHRRSNPRGGLDLSSNVAYANLVNVMSQGYAPAIRVVPGDPAASVLYNKILGNEVYGGEMPPGFLLTQSNIDLIRDWISQGAQDN